MADLATEAAAARTCTLCADRLPLGPRPVLRVSPSARLLIIGQAPGTKVHASGIPWNDPSGIRLRQWLQMDEAVFYDETKVAILPIGLCYPGVLSKGGDKPPMPVCAPTWHPRIIPALTNIRLTLLVGCYAQDFYLGKGAMTPRVAAFRSFLPRFLPLPHPSWRTVGWERRNPWFTTDLLPDLRARVAEAVS